MDHINDFELHDFIDDPNFDQFIDLIRGENEDHVAGFDSDLINSCFMVDTDQFGPTGNMFDFNVANTMTTENNPKYAIVNDATLPDFDHEIMKLGNQNWNDDVVVDRYVGEEYSSATTATITNATSAPQSAKCDRAKTLISERKRRSRMKEKLYALRSLVPNITKMDKASIVGDAVLYLQELQMQAKKLKSEISGLEASLVGAERFQENRNNIKFHHLRQNFSVSKKIMQIDVFQVDEKGFYVKLVCNKGEGVASSLYKALHSLTSFNLQNSNLSSTSHTYVLTFTLYVINGDQSLNLPNLKLWITGTLINQGFEFVTPLSVTQ